MNFRMARRTLLSAVALVAALAPTSLAQNASVYVVHGIRGEDLSVTPSLPVDVEVNGTCLLRGFQFRDVAGPLSLPAGTYDIKIRLATDTATCSGPVVIQASVPFAAGENATVIAHLDEQGAPTASKFVNDLSPSALGSRILFHHTAAAPTVDIKTRRLGSDRGLVVFPGVSNGLQGGAEYAPGSYALGVFLAGTEVVALGPARARIKEGRAYLVYVVGSASNGTLTTITLDPLLM